MYSLAVLLLVVGIMVILVATQKDILIPPILLSMFWALPLIVLSVAEGFGPGLLNVYALLFPLGILLFTVCFLLVVGGQIKRHAPGPVGRVGRFEATPALVLVIVIEYIVLIWFAVDAGAYVLQNFQYNVWYSLKWGHAVGYYNDMLIVEYARPAMRVLFLGVLFWYLNDKRFGRGVLTAQFVVTALFTVLDSGRGSVFMMLVPAVMLYLLVRRPPDRQILRVGLVSGAGLLLVFMAYSVLKSPYASQDLEVLMSGFKNYASGSLVAFCRWAASSPQHANGEYTLRFVNSVLAALGFGVTVKSLVEPFTETLPGQVGNVYTIYKWYANDFGLTYALLVQCALGGWYGYLYRRLFDVGSRWSAVWLVIYASSTYPLFMQFFMDVYISMTSTWIQYFFWAFIFLGTGVFAREIGGRSATESRGDALQRGWSQE